jgi:outer membrane murein-binding lipoprotein Lpp
MSKASPLFLAVILFCSAGMYGCTQQKGNAANTKLREMETRYAKLEEDYRAVQANAEAARKKLAQSEVEKAELVKEVEQLRPIVQERDELKKQLVTRTGERDNIQTQLTQFRQDLQSLISRVDGALNTATGTGTRVSALPASRRAE